MISTILSPRSLIHSSILTNLLLVPSHVYFISGIMFFTSDLFFFTFSISLLKCSLSFSIVISSLLSILMPVSLNSLSNYLSLFHLGFSVEFYLVPSFGAYPSISPFCLTLCLLLGVGWNRSLSQSWKCGFQVDCILNSFGRQVVVGAGVCSACLVCHLGWRGVFWVGWLAVCLLPCSYNLGGVAWCTWGLPPWALGMPCCLNCLWPQLGLYRGCFVSLHL